MTPGRDAREIRLQAALIESGETARILAELNRARVLARSRKRLARRDATAEWVEASSHPSYWSNV